MRIISVGLSSSIMGSRLMKRYISSSVNEWSLSGTNTFQHLLRKDPFSGSTSISRFCFGSHYSEVFPEKFNLGRLLVSKNCMEYLGLNADDSTAVVDSFEDILVRGILPDGFSTPIATNYGCHSYGEWFDQMGDGRALSLGEILVRNDRSSLNHTALKRYEIQLKGSGKTPFSRNFDGKATFRGALREFLVSEALYHLRVPTVRSLLVADTQDDITRPWYGTGVFERVDQYNRKMVDNNNRNNCDRPIRHVEKSPPDRLIKEKSAVLCRVGSSFLRFGHLELFAKRKDWPLLLEMTNYICFREYPECIESLRLVLSNWLESSTNANVDAIGSITKMEITYPLSMTTYVEMYRHIMKRSVQLICEWYRVGYTHGNMNSDNMHIAGLTLDLGPFAFMEEYDPLFQPFTSDTNGNFAFQRQISALSMNLRTLGEAFSGLLHYVCTLQGLHVSDLYRCLDDIEKIQQEELKMEFSRRFNEVKRLKLGLQKFEPEDDQLWHDLELLMAKSRVDFTIFFRELSKISSSMTPEVVSQACLPAFYRPEELILKKSYQGTTLHQDWIAWYQQYLTRIHKQDWTDKERQSIQLQNNPRIIMRNWMLALAYESWQNLSDSTHMQSLLQALEHPYDDPKPSSSNNNDQSAIQEDFWYQKTPEWARELPGVSFLSCSS